MYDASKKQRLIEDIVNLIEIPGHEINAEGVSAAIRDISELEIALDVLNYYASHRPAIVPDKEKYFPQFKNTTTRKSIAKSNLTFNDKKSLVYYIELMAASYKKAILVQPNRRLVPLYADVPAMFYYSFINYLEERAGVKLEDRTCREILRAPKK